MDVAYLESLSGYSLDRLSTEPVRLSVERRKIDAALEQLSVDNYRVHVDNHRAVRATRDACAGMGAAVRALRAGAEKELESGHVASALARAGRVAATYQRYRRTLRQHAKLLELFEIPQLMARCVRVHAVAEALDLATFVIKMERLHTLRYSVEQERKQGRGGGGSGSGGGAGAGAGEAVKNNGGEAATSLDAPATPDAGAEAPLALLPQRGSGLTIISDIAQDVMHSLDVLFTNLSRRLSGRIHLTEALQVVGFLRRLRLVYASGLAAALDVQKCRGEDSAATAATADEPDPSDGLSSPTMSHSLGQPIHEIFLNCRERFFQREIDRIPSSEEPHHYLERLADAYRVHLYDIITQYQAIFDDVQGGGGGSLEFEAVDVSGSEARAELLSRAVFSHLSFIIDRIHAYTPMIEDGSSLSNVIEQFMNLGHSLAKVGADFRPLLVGPFEEAMLGLALPAWNEGFLVFEDAIKKLDAASAGETGPGVSISNKSKKKLKTPWGHVGSALLSGSVKGEKGEEDEKKKERRGGVTDETAGDGSTEERRIANYHARLLLFRPLAHLTNACIGGFNELRKCASISIQERVRSALVELIGLAAKSITQSTAASSCILPGTSTTVRAELESLLRVEFVGTLAFCFRSVYTEADGCADSDFARAAGLQKSAEDMQEEVTAEEVAGASKVMNEAVVLSEGEEDEEVVPVESQFHSIVRGTLET
jgi:hypothetical protein